MTNIFFEDAQFQFKVKTERQLNKVNFVRQENYLFSFKTITELKVVSCNIAIVKGGGNINK